MADCVNLYIIERIKSVVGQFIIFANFEEKKNHQTLNTSFDI